MLIGIVGKPSSGKSTFFSAATLQPVEISPVPFTTIEPNVGVAYVRVECPEKEFNVKCNPREGFCKDGIRFVPVKMIDVAGLIPEAHKGKGLGNQFLNDLNQADVLIHVVDASGSTNEKGETVPPFSHDPIFDIEFLEKELVMWIAGIIEKNLQKMLREKRAGKKDWEILHETLSGIKVTQNLAKEIIEKFGEIGKFSIEDVAKYIREKTKPIVIAANKADVEGVEKNIERIKERHRWVVPVSAESELVLKRASKKGLIDYLPGEKDFKIIHQLTEEQKRALDFIRKRVLERFGSTGVQRVIETAVFQVLKMKVVFPVAENLCDKEGNVLPDAFLLEENATLLDLARKIHTEIAEKLMHGIDVRTKRRIGKDYKLKHRDVVTLITSR